MITIKQYSSDLKFIWNEFNKSAKNSLFMFNRDFMEYHSDRFIDNSLLFYDDDELCALLPCNIKDGILYSHGGLTYGGFITDTKMKQHRMNDCFVTLRSYMKENDIPKIIYKTIPYFYHKQPAQEDLYSLFINNASITKIEASTLINLESPLKLARDRRGHINRAKREGVEIIESENFEKFIKLENEVLWEHHGLIAVHTGAELSLLHSRFPENIKLYAAMYKGEMIAGSVVFAYDTVVHTQYMASNNEGREIGALDLTVVTIIEKYKETKNFLDFGISTEDGGHFLNEGLISQKESFGGRTVVYQTWEMGQ